MSWAVDIMRTAQDEARYALLSDSWFNTIGVYLQRKGNVTQQVQSALKLQTKRNGKAGAAIVVYMPFFRKDSANQTPGLPGALTLRLGVFEHVRMNQDASLGTLLSAESIAIAAMDLIHRLTGLDGLYFEGLSIQPRGESDGVVEYVVEFSVRAHPVRNQVAAPEIVSAGGNVTITTATAGATIYFSDDGEYPGAGNASATLYSAPFADPASGSTVRAMAYKDDFKPSAAKPLVIT